MPETEDTAESRKQAAETLRAVADLIEGRPDLPQPSAQVRFYVSAHACGGDVPATLAAITSALPGPFKASISRSGENAWLCLDSSTGGSDPAEIHVAAPASEACSPSGTRTITTWEPLPEVAALIGDTGVLEEM